jgi:hypothetical protein
MATARSYHPWAVLLRYFGGGLCQPLSDGSVGVSTWLRSPLFLFTIEWRTHERWNAKTMRTSRVLDGAQFTFSWAPKSWTFRISPGDRLFRRSVSAYLPVR